LFGMEGFEVMMGLHCSFCGRENIFLAENFQFRQTNSPFSRLLIMP
jgi:hypothetical protein